MRYLVIVLRALSLTGKLGTLLPRFYLVKRSARKHFSAELIRLGIGLEQVQVLTDAYGEMIHLNPVAYFPASESKRNHRRSSGR